MSVPISVMRQIMIRIIVCLKTCSSLGKIMELQYKMECQLRFLYCDFQKQPPRRVFRKMCSENMQQSYRRTPMLKCDFNEVSKQLY